MHNIDIRGASAQSAHWAIMWSAQVKRVKENIFPFFLIGLAAGLVVGAADRINQLAWLSNYFKYANISIDYSAVANSVLFEHLAPNTLVFLLVSIGVLSALHRIVCGAMETAPTERKGVIFALENFASLLAIAWLGILLGLLIPGRLFGGWHTMAQFAFLAIYPLLYLIEVSAATTLMYCELKYRRPDFVHELFKWKMQTRLEGLVILLAAFALLTYYKQFNSFIGTTLPELIRFLVQAI